MLLTDKYVGFWGTEFSNFCDFYPIKYNGEDWLTSEHIFMYEKAMYFEDVDTAEKIKKADHPAKAKRLGRKVKNFSEESWTKVREEKMLIALRAKFKVPEYQRVLLKTEDRKMVEASPYDSIWGIGFGEEDMLKVSESKWGLNLLGKCLEVVRGEIKEEEA